MAEQRFVIQGGHALSGTVRLSGAKNAALPALALSLLAEGPVRLGSVPTGMRDVAIMLEVLTQVGCEVSVDGDQVTVDSRTATQWEVPDEPCNQIRGGLLLLGALVARFGRASVPAPGGCKIGPRGYDIHLNGLQALGAEVEGRLDRIVVTGEKLTGTDIHLRLPSTTGTETLMMAALRAKGRTTLHNANTRPEIVDLVLMCNRLGADVTVGGSNLAVINGPSQVRGGAYDIMPGYDEAITYIVAGALLGESVRIENIEPAHLQIPLGVLEMGGARIHRHPAALEVSRGDDLRAVNVVTGTHPAMNSDLQPAFAVYGCCATGATRITDTRFTQRFGYREELAKLGAEIEVEGNAALIRGPHRLHGATVKAPDLRAGAALVLAGMVAEGETVIENIGQIDRGFEGLEEKLRRLGADIGRVSN